MARYVVVSVYEYDKAIKEGPYEADDPAQVPLEEGQVLMLESEALAAGYYYASDGAFAPGGPCGAEEHGKKTGHHKSKREK